MDYIFGGEGCWRQCQKKVNVEFYGGTVAMKDEASKAVERKISGVEGEQGSAKEAGSEPPKSFGHGSASSEGVSGSIPKES